MKHYMNASSKMVPNRLNIKKLSHQINSVQTSFNNTVNKNVKFLRNFSYDVKSISGNTNNEENSSESSEIVMTTPIEK